MSYTDPTFAINTIQSLQDQPTITSTQLKVSFDKASSDIKAYLLAHNTELGATTDGASGLDKLGMTPLDGYVAKTPQATFEEMDDKINTLLPFPDGSVTNQKLATDVKVGSLALLETTEKSSVVGAINEIANMTNDSGTISELPISPSIADRFFLTDKLLDSQWNGSFWQRYDGKNALFTNIEDGNIYPLYSFYPQDISVASDLPNSINTPVDMTKDFIAYTKFKLSSSTDYVHLNFLIGAAFQAQLTFGYDWVGSSADGQTISVYDYINTTGYAIGVLDMTDVSHEVIVWYDNKSGYVNVFIDDVLIGSWLPIAANISGTDTLSFRVGSVATSITFDYVYMATPLVTAIGDSITAGSLLYDPDPSTIVGVDDYLNNYPRYISDKLHSDGLRNYFVINKGVPANTTTQMVSRFSADIVATGCKYTLIHGGINDFATLTELQTASNKRAMAKSAIAANITPYILGVTPTAVANPAHSYSISLHALELTAYSLYKYIDLWESIEGSTPNVADPAKISDTIHPNTTGYASIGAAINIKI